MQILLNWCKNRQNNDKVIQIGAKFTWNLGKSWNFPTKTSLRILNYRWKMYEIKNIANNTSITSKMWFSSLLITYLWFHFRIAHFHPQTDTNHTTAAIRQTHVSNITLLRKHKSHWMRQDTSSIRFGSENAGEWDESSDGTHKITNVPRTYMISDNLPDEHWAQYGTEGKKRTTHSDQQTRVFGWQVDNVDAVTNRHC